MKSDTRLTELPQLLDHSLKRLTETCIIPLSDSVFIRKIYSLCRSAAICRRVMLLIKSFDFPVVSFMAPKERKAATDVEFIIRCFVRRAEAVVQWFKTQK
jgi:hypothetical protein